MASPEPLTAEAVLAELAALGTEQTRKTWRRHGATDPMFGVKYGDLEGLVKRLRRTRAPLDGLAEALWASGNHDARVLACKIHSGTGLTPEQVLAWVEACANYGLADEVAGLVARRADAAAWATRLAADPREYPGRIGWRLVVHLALAPDADDGPLVDWLIEAVEVLSTAPALMPNRKRQAMYDALIAIGGARAALRPRALEGAARIGRLEIDHGDTACKTPDAGPYIVKMVAHRAAQAAKAAARAASKGAGRAAGSG